MARRGAGRRRAAVVTKESQVASFGAELFLRHLKVPPGPPQPARCPPHRPAPAVHILSHTRLFQDSPVHFLHSRLRSAWCTGLLPSSGAAPGGRVGQLLRPRCFSVAILAASAGPAAAAFVSIALPRVCLFCCVLQCILLQNGQSKVGKSKTTVIIN